MTSSFFVRSYVVIIRKIPFPNSILTAVKGSILQSGCLNKPKITNKLVNSCLTQISRDNPNHNLYSDVYDMTIFLVLMLYNNCPDQSSTFPFIARLNSS